MPFSGQQDTTHGLVHGLLQRTSLSASCEADAASAPLPLDASRNAEAPGHSQVNSIDTRSWLPEPPVPKLARTWQYSGKTRHSHHSYGGRLRCKSGSGRSHWVCWLF